MKERSRRDIIFIICLVLMCAACAAAAAYRARYLLPLWIRWDRRDSVFVPDAEQNLQIRVTLSNRTLRAVTEADQVVFESKKGWHVQDCLLFDLTGDGQEELIFLTWRRGSYGSSRPFWVTREEWNYSQHLYIYEWREGTFQPLWMSSDMGMEIRSWRMDGEGQIFLTAAEGYTTVWKWDGWGLMYVRKEYSEDGSDAEDPPGTEEESSVTAEETAAEENVAEGTAEETSEAAEEETGEEKRTLSMIAVGDNLTHGSVYRAAMNKETGEYDFHDIYADVREKLSSCDLAVVNQETVLVEDPSYYGSFPDFGTPLAMGEALADTGFDIILSATNHTADRGERGILDTQSFWKNYPDVTVLGIHEDTSSYEKIDILECNGIRLALFNYTYGLNGHTLPSGKQWMVNVFEDKEKLIKDLHAAESLADCSVCFLHIGKEYSDVPSDETREMVKTVAEAGADVIICSHPHVVQGAEKLTSEDGHSAIVCWSLGNFMSNQMDLRTVVGAAAELTFCLEEDGGMSVRCGLTPTVCHFKNGRTRVYFLEDYTDELAAEHSLSDPDQPLTVSALRGIADESGAFSQELLIQNKDSP